MARLDIKELKPGATAYTLRVKRKYEDDAEHYAAYIRPVKIKSTGRKIVTLESGAKFAHTDESDNVEWLTERTIYSAEQLLFATRDTAVDYIVRHETLDDIRELVHRLSIRGTDSGTLKEIRRLMRIAAGIDNPNT